MTKRPTIVAGLAAVAAAAVLYYVYQRSHDKVLSLKTTDAIESLLDMGYEDIFLQDCILEFSRQVKPTTKNNGYVSYYRYLDLNTFSEFAQSMVEPSEFADGLYEIVMEFDKSYYKQYSKVESFKNG